MQSLSNSRAAASSSRRRESSALIWLPLPSANVPVTRKYSSGTNDLISSSRSTMRRTATDCTRPADNDGLIFFHNTGESSKPTMRSSTRRACCASTRLRSMSRGFSIALRIAVLVISWNTMRLVFSGLRSNTSYKCHAIASPSRSSSDASHTISALFAAFFNSLTRFLLSSGISYIGAKLLSTSMLKLFSFRSRMCP